MEPPNPTDSPLWPWFELGANALARSFPGYPWGYACPICTGLFLPGEIDLLTPDHAPPGSLGGTKVALTCGPCNHWAGSQLESHMQTYERLVDFHFAPEMRESLPIRLSGLSGRGETMNAVVTVEPGLSQRIVVVKASPSRHHNRRGYQDEWAAAFPTLQGRARERGTLLQFTFWKSYRPRRVRVGWLRSAYIVAFAAFGYRYSLSPFLDRVRDQMRNPDSDVLSTFAVIDPTADKRIRQMQLVEQPEWLRCLAVRMGRHTVMLPAGDDNVYERIAQHRQDSDLLQYIPGPEIPWPTGPSFSCDLGQD